MHAYWFVPGCPYRQFCYTQMMNKLNNPNHGPHHNHFNGYAVTRNDNR